MSERNTGWLATLWEYKLWWMIPMALIVLAFVALLVLADSTGDAPFIYTLF
jgi:hypothetical protein